MTEVSNSQDVLDVRDIIERFEELSDEREALQDEVDAIAASADEPEADETDHKANLSEWDDDNCREFKLLESLLSDLCGNGGDHQWKGDWYPVTLIRDSYFEDAMDELLEDIGELPKDLPSYLNIEVDYKALQMDYSSVEFDGVTYWYR